MPVADVPHFTARNEVSFQFDKAGFLIISLKPETGQILVEHFNNSGEPTSVIEGSDPAVICAELIQRGFVSQLDHAAYLGRELERAKLSMELGLTFVQAAPHGEADAVTLPQF